MENQKNDYITSHPEALREIYIRMYNRLYKFGCSIEHNEELVHDEIQGLFLWLLENPKKLEKIEKLEVYLFQSLRRNIRSSARTIRQKKSRHTGFYLQFDNEIFSKEDTIIGLEERDETSLRLNRALNQLTTHQKEVLYLRFYDGLDYDEIAEIQGVSNQVARNAVSRAMKKLRRVISSIPGENIVIGLSIYIILFLI